jgi:hypothetical protein
LVLDFGVRLNVVGYKRKQKEAKKIGSALAPAHATWNIN